MLYYMYAHKFIQSPTEIIVSGEYIDLNYMHILLQGVLHLPHHVHMGTARDIRDMHRRKLLFQNRQTNLKHCRKGNCQLSASG